MVADFRNRLRASKPDLNITDEMRKLARQVVDDFHFACNRTTGNGWKDIPVRHTKDLARVITTQLVDVSAIELMIAESSIKREPHYTKLKRLIRETNSDLVAQADIDAAFNKIVDEQARSKGLHYPPAAFDGFGRAV